MKNYVLDTFYTHTLYGIFNIVLTYLFICGFLSFKDITTFIWKFGDGTSLEKCQANQKNGQCPEYNLGNTSLKTKLCLIHGLITVPFQSSLMAMKAEGSPECTEFGKHYAKAFTAIFLVPVTKVMKSSRDLKTFLNAVFKVFKQSNSNQLHIEYEIWKAKEITYS